MLNVVERIRRKSGELTKSETVVARYVLEHPMDIAFMAALRLGERAGVSESTVFRFAKSLGYTTYQALQSEARGEIQQRLHETTPARLERTIAENPSEWMALVGAFGDDLANLERTLQQLSEPAFMEVVDLLAVADTVWVVGFRGATGLASLLSYTLNLIRPGVRSLSERADTFYDRLIDLDKRDVLLATSFSRQSRRTLEIVDLARSKGTSIVAVTDDALSPLGRASDHALIVSVHSRAFIQSYTAAFALAHGLFAAMSLRLSDSARERLGKLESELERYSVFRDEALGS